MIKKLLFLALICILLSAFSYSSRGEQTNPKVTMKTSLGDIIIELYPNKAPITVQNFLAYVDAQFYDDTIFHRVIPNFMIQGGGLTSDFVEKPTNPAIKNEAANGLKNDRGTIAMARMPEIDSATCQFFINHVDNSFLDYGTASDGWGYCVFGKVVNGLDVVDAIANSPTMTKYGMQDVPRETIKIISISRLN